MVKLRRYRRRGVALDGGGWEVDVRVELPSGRRYRERKLYRDSASTKAEARAWAEEREHEVRALARQGLDLEAIRRALHGETEKGPTLEEFWPDFVDGYVKANGEKHSSLRTRESIYREHFAPWYALPLSAISTEKVQRLKGRLLHAGRAPKTVNNVLTCLSSVLKAAVEWKRIRAMPCTIKLVKVDTTKPPEFYETDYERMVMAANLVGPAETIIVLLGGDAGLRKGEMIALEWDDLDLVRGRIVVQRAEYRGVVGAPKGGKTRVVPMTARLLAALKAHRHLRGARCVFHLTDGKTMSEEWVRGAIKRVEKRAGLPVTKGKCHKLRHTSCTRLAMAGQAPRTIQALAGHVSTETTMRYMHVTKAAPAAAIAALDARIGGRAVGAQDRAEET